MRDNPPVNEAPGYQLTVAERRDAYIRELAAADAALARAQKLLPGSHNDRSALLSLRTNVNNLIRSNE